MCSRTCVRPCLCRGYANAASTKSSLALWWTERSLSNSWEMLQFHCCCPTKIREISIHHWNQSAVQRCRFCRSLSAQWGLSFQSYGSLLLVVCRTIIFSYSAHQCYHWIWKPFNCSTLSSKVGTSSLPFRIDTISNFLAPYNVDFFPARPQCHFKHLFKQKHGVIRAIFRWLKSANFEADARLYTVFATRISNELYRSETMSSLEISEN